LNSNSGYIKGIDISKGELCVGSSQTPLDSNAPCDFPNAQVYLNDPSGKYGKPQTNFDLRAQLDPENAAVKASTGARLFSILSFKLLCADNMFDSL
jgi:hypothetical protein